MKKIKRLLCAWFGHSRVVDSFWGYIHCGRCNDQIGDTLGGVYLLKDCVLIDCPEGITCKHCHDNWNDLHWHEKILISNPFSKASRDD